MDRILQRILPRVRPEGVDSIQSIKTLIVCCIVFLLSGATTSMTFFQIFHDNFHLPFTATPLPIDVNFFVKTLSGIILAPLAMRFSVRPLIFVCTLLGAFGYMINFLVNDLYVASAGFGGVGLCSTMMIITVSVLVTQHFRKYRMLAMNIAFLCNFLSLVAYTMLVPKVYVSYGYHSLMLSSGICLLLCVPLCYFLQEISPDASDRSSDSMEYDSEPLSVIAKNQLKVFLKPGLYLLITAAVSMYFSNSVTDSMSYYLKDIWSGRDDQISILVIVLRAEGYLLLPILFTLFNVSDEVLASVAYMLIGLLMMVCNHVTTYGLLVTLLGFTMPAVSLIECMFRAFVGDYVGRNRIKPVFAFFLVLEGLLIRYGIALYKNLFDINTDKFARLCRTYGIVSFAVSLAWLTALIIKKVVMRRRRGNIHFYPEEL